MQKPGNSKKFTPQFRGKDIRINHNEVNCQLGFNACSTFVETLKALVFGERINPKSERRSPMLTFKDIHSGRTIGKRDEFNLLLVLHSPLSAF
jgi:hypothetical protein